MLNCQSSSNCALLLADRILFVNRGRAAGFLLQKKQSFAIKIHNTLLNFDDYS